MYLTDLPKFAPLESTRRFRKLPGVQQTAKTSKKLATDCMKTEEFVFLQLWGTEHHPQDVRPACEASLRRLQLDYVDLYHVHWPVHLPVRPHLLFVTHLICSWLLRAKFTDGNAEFRWA